MKKIFILAFMVIFSSETSFLKSKNVDFVLHENYNDLLKFASKNGDLKLAKISVEKGAKNLNDCLNIASQHDHLKIVKFLIKKGASNFYDASSHAFLYKNMEVVDFISKFLNKD